MLTKWLLRRLIVATGYIANYGYTDGSGNFYIIVDTEKCDGCDKCTAACPQHIFQVISDDYDDRVAEVKELHRKNLKYICAPCKPASGHKDLPCVVSCPGGAITHSW